MESIINIGGIYIVVALALLVIAVAVFLVKKAIKVGLVIIVIALLLGVNGIDIINSINETAGRIYKEGNAIVVKALDNKEFRIDKEMISDITAKEKNEQGEEIVELEVTSKTGEKETIELDKALWKVLEKQIGK